MNRAERLEWGNRFLRIWEKLSVQTNRPARSVRTKDLSDDDVEAIRQAKPRSCKSCKGWGQMDPSGQSYEVRLCPECPDDGRERW